MCTCLLYCRVDSYERLRDSRKFGKLAKGLTFALSALWHVSTLVMFLLLLGVGTRPGKRVALTFSHNPVPHSTCGSQGFYAGYFIFFLQYYFIESIHSSFVSSPLPAPSLLSCTCPPSPIPPPAHPTLPADSNAVWQISGER